MSWPLTDPAEHARPSNIAKPIRPRSTRPAIDEAVGARQHLHWSAAETPALLWLSAVPVWDARLARECDFPESDVAAFVARLRSLKLLEVARGFDEEGEDLLTFWLSPNRRADAVREFHARSDRRDVFGEMAKIAGLVRDSSDGSTNPLTVRWADLTVELGDDPTETARSIAKRVDALCSAERMAEAVDFAKACQPLADLLGDPFDGAVGRARRRVDRGFRALADKRYLADALVRTDHVDKLVDLMSPRGPKALHVVGMGGVGKTMLVRYLQSNLVTNERYLAEVPEEQRALAVARIDFDAVLPSVALERPGELLLELADELIAYATVEAEDVRASLEARVKAMAGQAVFTRGGAVGPDLAAAVDVFATFCRFLTGRPVLVFDTCEELAKRHPPGQQVLAIERLFTLVNAVLAARPEARVVFAGRRLLATKYHNREIDRSALLPEGIVSLAKRPDVELLQVRGFDKSEVREFLTVNRELAVAERTITRIFDAADDAGEVQGLGVTATDTRALPFDVDLFGHLLQGLDPDDHDAVTFDLDAYVEERIVQRIEHPAVRAILPAAALFGDFDRDMVAPLVPASDDPRRTVDRLLEQEWVDLRSGVGDRTVVSIEAGLRPKLLRHYERTGKLTAAKERLGPCLERLVTEREPLERMPPEHLAWALRLLPPADAHRLLGYVERRAERENGWPLLGAVAETLLAPPDDLPGVPGPAVEEAALRHLAAGAFRRLGEYEVSVANYSEVSAPPTAPSAPAVGFGLQSRRAELLHLALTSDDVDLDTGIEHVESAISALLADGGDAVAATPAVITALEAFDGRLAAEGRAGRPRSATLVLVDPELIAEFLDRVTDKVHPVLAAGGWTQLARSRVLLEDDDAAATAAFARAAELAGVVRGDPFSSADWTPPADPLARARLEWLGAAYATGSIDQPPDLATWRPDPATSVDADRLWSLLALWRLDTDPRSSLVEWGAPLALSEPLCAAHERVPPAMIADGLLRAAVGDPFGAMASIELAIHQAERSASARTGMLADAYTAGLTVIRQWRLGDLAPFIQRAMAQPGMLTLATQTAVLVDTPGSFVARRFPAEAFDYAATLMAREQLPGAERGQRRLDAIETLEAAYPLAGTGFFKYLVEIDHRVLGWSDLERYDRLRAAHFPWGQSGTSLPPRFNRRGRAARMRLRAAELDAIRDPRPALRLVPEPHDVLVPVDALGAVSVTIGAAKRSGTPTSYDRSDLDVRCAAVAGDVGGWRDRVATLQASLDGQRLGLSDDDSPIELAGLDSPTKAQTARRRLASIAGIALGILIWLAICVGVVWVARQLEDLLLGNDPGWFAAVVHIGWVIMGIAVVTVGIRRIRSGRFLRVKHTMVDIGRTAPGLVVRCRASCQPVGSPSALARWIQRAVIELLGPLDRTHRWSAEIVDRGPPDATPSPGMRELFGRRSTRRIVQLQVAPEATECAWEQWRVAGARSSNLLHYRAYPSTTAAGLPTLSGAATVLAAPTLQSMADHAWRGRATPRLCVTPDEVPTEPGILHVLGTPRRTPNGWCIEVDEWRAAYGGPGAATLVRPEQLPVGNAELVVMQARPTTYVEADDLCGLRALADAFIASGAPAVLTIPPMPRDDALRVVRKAVTSLAGLKRPWLASLLDISAAMRRLTPAPADVALHVAARPYGLRDVIGHVRPPKQESTS